MSGDFSNMIQIPPPGKKQRDLWEGVAAKLYYFNKSGNCTKVYDAETGQLKVRKNGKMRLARRAVSSLNDGKLYYFQKNGLCRLPNGKLYYFNAKGIRITQKGWQEVSKYQYLQFGKKCYIIAKLEKKSSYWKFYKYDYPKGAWQKQKDIWKTRNSARTQEAVLNHVKDSDIVLMHDLYQQTTEASAAIIPKLINRGYQLVTISELSDCRGGMAPGAVYRSFP